MIRTDKYKIFRIPIERIYPNPAQPREVFDEDQLRDLSKSILENGILQPVTVRKNEKGQYEIVAGERRVRAAKMAGLKTLPCIITDCSPDQSAVLALIENIQRCDLNYFEEAAAIKALTEVTGMTQEETARCLGKSQSAVANKLRLLRLSEEERVKIRAGGLTERHARALLKLDDPAVRRKVIDEILKKQLNVGQTDKLVELYLKQKEPSQLKKRKFILKDIRIFLNTIGKAVDTVRFSGLDAQFTKKETDQYIECVVRIPKSR